MERRISNVEHRTPNPPWLSESACGSPSPIYHLLSFKRSLGWWNGRHVRLRGVCRKACGFKSRPEHGFRFAERRSVSVRSVRPPASWFLDQKRRLSSRRFTENGGPRNRGFLLKCQQKYGPFRGAFCPCFRHSASRFLLPDLGLSDAACVWYKNRTHIPSHMNTPDLGPIVEVISQRSDIGGQN